MRIPRIYHPDTLTAGSTVELAATAAQHVSKVLRLRDGAPLILFDGQGNACHARLHSHGKQYVRVEILETFAEANESPLHIHLGLGISKGERMDYAIQKAVETGVNEITPLLTEHTVVKLEDKRRESRRQHWQGIIVSACEQCGRNRLPQLHPVMSLTDWVTVVNPEHKLLFDGSGKTTLRSISPVPNAVAVLIGPEGGLHAKEIELAEQYGFKSVRLGPRILRTETAAVAIVASLQALWGDYL